MKGFFLIFIFQFSAPVLAAEKNGLTREQIQTTVNANMGKILACYEESLKKAPQLAGRVNVEFVVAPDGKVIKSKVSRTTLAHKTTQDCVLATLNTWTFPKPVGEESVTVTYPFVFTQNKPK